MVGDGYNDIEAFRMAESSYCL